jgi:hypothetical protein
MNNALEKSGDFKIGRNVICTAKYAEYLVQPDKKKTLLQGMTDRLIEIGR